MAGLNTEQVVRSWLHKNCPKYENKHAADIAFLQLNTDLFENFYSWTEVKATICLSHLQTQSLFMTCTFCLILVKRNIWKYTAWSTRQTAPS